VWLRHRRSGGAQRLPAAHRAALVNAAVACGGALVCVCAMVWQHVWLIIYNETSVEQCFNEAQAARMAARARSTGRAHSWQNVFDLGSSLSNAEQLFGRLRCCRASLPRALQLLALMLPFLCDAHFFSRADGRRFPTSDGEWLVDWHDDLGGVYPPIETALKSAGDARAVFKAMQHGRKLISRQQQQS
jgi:hypothetical protein